MFKKKLNKTINYFSKFLLKIFVNLNFPFLSSLILLINLRRVKSINSQKIKKKIIILAKSGGIEDILFAYKKLDKNNDIGYFILPRNLIKVIFFRFLKNEKYGDYLTIDFNENIKIKKKRYKLFIKQMFLHLDNIWNFEAVLGFNPFYYAENDLPEPIKSIGKKFLIIHKESVHTPFAHELNFKVYRDYNKKNLADKVAVYCQYEKNNLVNSNILEPSQLEVVGCARSDYCYELRKKKPLDNRVVYYMIVSERDRRFEKLLQLSKDQIINWFQLANLTIKYLVEYALKNPDVDIIFKGKWGVHSLSDLPKNLPNNCSFELGNPGHKFLKDAKVVICFNSTILFEAIMANREIVIPNFKVDRLELEKFMLKSPNKFADTKKDFFEMINRSLKTPYEIKNFSDAEKESVDFYLGNTDGKAGNRLKRFIEENL